MFGKPFKVFSLRGIPVMIDVSFIFIAGLFVFLLRRNFAGDDGSAYLYAAITTVLFFGSIFVHELAHAVVGRAKHIGVKSITLWMFGGLTQFDLQRHRNAGEQFQISFAGPLTTLVLAGVFFFFERVVATGLGFNWGEVFAILAAGNLFMAILNILPGYPMDGGQVLLAGLWQLTGDRAKATRWTATVGIVFAVGVFLFAGWAFVNGNTFGGFWFAYIGFMLFQGSRQTLQMERQQAMLAGGVVADAMSAPPVAIPGGLTLSEAYDRFLKGNETVRYPVLDEASGRLVGVIDFAAAGRIGQTEPLRPVRDAMVPLDQSYMVQGNATLADVTPRVAEEGTALVVRDGQLIGLLTVDDILAWVNRPATLPAPGSATGPAALPLDERVRGEG